MSDEELDEKLKEGREMKKLHDDGKSTTEIADEFDYSQSTVSRRIRRYEDYLKNQQQQTVQELEKKTEEIEQKGEVEDEDLHDIQRVIGEILTLEEKAYEHGRTTGADIATLQNALQKLHDLDSTELMNIAQNVGGIILGYREGNKSFSDVREMTKKAKKFDEIKDTIMRTVPDEVKKEVKKKLQGDGGG